MPLTSISLRRGKPAAYRKALMRGVYEAMRETFTVPEEDRFMTVSEYDEAQFDYGPDYLGIHRSDDLVMIQITANDTRNLEQKKALYAAIAGKLSRDPGLDPANIFINLVEVKKENWSFGNGVAQYV
ncbi:Tautomerase enzyme [Rhizobiales bacterium GAS191]|nr:Tautomerase enzyme [Rhizobiales bacterium GAS113]SEB93614.1 Tautomerase enzyme [Rhizobiales bacterium GAS191]SED24533.1 Tautomerase enzyme [Rhizobiales bacterium GAS188]